MSFQWPLRVYIEDTDFGGIVYYVNYLKFMERARTEMLRAHGFGQRELAEQSNLIVVQNVECQYRQPARLDDELIVVTTVDEVGAATAQLSQKVVRQPDQQLLCEGRVRLASVSREALRPSRWPKAVRAALQSIQE